MQSQPDGRVDWKTAVGAFREADWTFKSRSARRELHPYPARFIPQIPAQALDILKVRGPVLDPFCGSGTSLAEARRRSLSAIGSDINPIACLISRVVTQSWERSDASTGMEHAANLHQYARRGSDDSALGRDIPRLDHWFDVWAQEALAGAVRYLETIDADDPWRDRVAVAISSAVVRISRQDSDTRYAAVRKSGNRESAATDLYQAMIRVCEWMAHNCVDFGSGTSLVIQADARSLSFVRDASVGAAIFSPPYPNAYEYWLYHKYRMYWLGFDPIAVRSQEMGARPHYCRPNGLTEHDFRAQMCEVFGELRRVLIPEAPVVVVIGDSVIQGRWIDNRELIESSAGSQNFDVCVCLERPIRVSRSSFNRAHSRGRLNEHVILLRAPSGR